MESAYSLAKDLGPGPEGLQRFLDQLALVADGEEDVEDAKVSVLGVHWGHLWCTKAYHTETVCLSVIVSLPYQGHNAESKDTMQRVGEYLGDPTTMAGSPVYPVP